MNSTDLKDHLRRTTWAEPSPELRARVLSEAHVAPDAITWSDRIWFSRRWRRGALGAVVVLFGVAAWSGPAVPELSPSAESRAATTFAEDVARDAGLEPELAAAIGRRATARPRRPARIPGQTIAAPLTEGGDRE